MQRDQRMRASFNTIERMARRQAARLKREMAANHPDIIDSLPTVRALCRITSPRNTRRQLRQA